MWPQKITKNGDKTQKLKFLQNSKTQILTKLKKIKWWQTSKTQLMTVVILTVVTVVVIVTYFTKNNSTPRQPMRCVQGSFLQFSQCLFVKSEWPSSALFFLPPCLNSKR